MMAGRLRHRVTLQGKTVTGQDSYGQDTYKWTDLASFYASERLTSGREIEALQQTSAMQFYSLISRYQPGLTVKREYRLKFGSRFLEILAADDPDGRKRELWWTCKEWVE